MRFTVLASGSAGNVSLVEADGFGVLLDAGLGPRQLAKRLAEIGASWKSIRAVLLTHTHGDHWRESTLAQLARLGVPLWCHPDHQTHLTRWSAAFGRLVAAGLVRTYEAGQAFELTPRLGCRPLAVRHDSGATFGFRIEGATDLFQAPAVLGYAADLGSWTLELARDLADADVLALEFNHDVGLEYASGRSPRLIARVLGEEGHLSNEQAAALLAEVLRQSAPGRLRHVVQLHLSRECNRPWLAVAAAERVLQEMARNVELHTASQDRISPCLSLGTGDRPARNRQTALGQPHRRTSRSASLMQRWLPGFEYSTSEPRPSGSGETPTAYERARLGNSTTAPPS